MITVVSILTVVVFLVLIAFIVAAWVYLRQAGRATQEITELAAALRDSLPPLADESRRSVKEAGELAVSARAAVESVRSLLEGRSVTEAAGKAVTASKVTVVSLLEGLKQGLKALRTQESTSKEEPKDEEG